MDWPTSSLNLNPNSQYLSGRITFRGVKLVNKQRAPRLILRKQNLSHFAGKDHSRKTEHFDDFQTQYKRFLNGTLSLATKLRNHADG
jgi:hypothetical protein